ncbi:BMP family ABC transporter substrate-binding protein [Streptomyces yaanensis]|uniref:BMP family ABC transporter substrate-binding protein n=1 Tax=Streptomyces yaanensis TaxID=1142239 RepID=A0ABV7SP31_9ACTN|nr:BMP family ABC transporter substrate-binding protein [Streptomyces sp. CGMCC 4.7035]WNB97412.1 BMP family ABC transporter substrate-binding protein [Streptomyces sp. CGMCC 4.7035]
MAAAADALRGPKGWAAGGVAVLALGLAGVAWLFLGDDERGTPPDPRARQYREVDACLLTGEKGIAQGTLAASVWEGMQKASLDTRARVNYVPVTGDQSAGNARPFFNSLIQRQCDVVLAVGAPQVQVTQAAAAKNPKVRFVVVDDASEAKAERPGNVTVAQPGGELKETVAETIKEAVRASHG